MLDARAARAARTSTVFGAVTVASIALAGCDLDNPGRAVVPGELNFPIAVALAGASGEGGRTYLLVANANFDVRYASGSLQSYAIDAIEAAIEAAIASGECNPAAYEHCRFDDGRARESFLVHEVLVGSHMDGLELATDGRRVYLPVRSGNGVLTWVDFDPTTGRFECGNTPDPRSGIDACDAAHRRPDSSIAAARGLALPSDPVAIAVGGIDPPGTPNPRGDFLVVAHRNGNASLFVDERVAGAPPRFVHTLGGLPVDIVGAERDPSGRVWLTSASVGANRASRDLVALEVNVVPEAGLAAAELTVAQRVTLNGIDDGLDTRDIAMDPHRGPADPLRMWVLARRPEAVIEIDFSMPPLIQGAAPIGSIHWVGSGPSRLVTFEQEGRTLLLASCYDAHTLVLVDPDLGAVASVTAAELAGPFEMAVDGVRQRAYVADFRLSVLWVIDLSTLSTGGDPVVLARIGTGHAPTVFR